MNKLNTSFIGLILLITLSSLEINAQQEPQFTQFWNTKNYFNPATAGLNYKYQATLLANDQWKEYYGDPQTQLVSYSMKIDKLLGGIGANYLHYNIGFSEINKVKLNYSYQMVFDNEGVLSFGLAAGIQHYKQTPIWLIPEPYPNYPGAFSDAQFTSDFGMAYSKDRLNVGLSVTQLNEARYTGNNNIHQDARHYFFFADYAFGNSEKFQIVPQLFYKTDASFQTLEINTLLKYKSTYFIGASYRNRDAFAFMAGWDIKQKFRVSYSYDVTVSKLNNGVSGGTHEFALGLLLK